MEIYLCTHGRPLFHGEKLREFIHLPQIEKGCYVWQKRSLSVEEHAAVARKVIEANPDFKIYTRIVASASVTPNAERKRSKDAARIKELEAQIKEQKEEIARLRRALTPPARAPHE